MARNIQELLKTIKCTAKVGINKSLGWYMKGLGCMARRKELSIRSVPTDREGQVCGISANLSII